MITIDYDNTGVEIDYCPACRGVWLDSGEFGKIIDALLEELTTKSAGDYWKATLQEAKEIITGKEGLISEWKDFSNVVRMMQYRILAENPKLGEAIASYQQSSPF